MKKRKLAETHSDINTDTENSKQQRRVHAKKNYSSDDDSDNYLSSNLVSAKCSSRKKYKYESPPVKYKKLSTKFDNSSSQILDSWPEFPSKDSSHSKNVNDNVFININNEPIQCTSETDDTVLPHNMSPPFNLPNTKL